MKVQKRLPKYFWFLSIIITLLFSNFAIKAQCLNGWEYYRPVVVVNNTSTSLTNFQVKISVNTVTLISAGKMNSAGDDIRFVDSGGCSIINYYIESGINTSSTIIWLKMPVLPSNAHRTIKMYYGNSSVSAGSNGDSTFVMFDDFLGTTISSNWNTYGSSNSSYSVSSGQLTINAGTSSTSTIGSRVMVSVASYPSPLIVESNITYTTGFYSNIGMLNSGTWNGYSIYNGDATAGANQGMHIGQDVSSSVDYASAIKTTNTSPGQLTGIWQMNWPSSNIQSGFWPGGTASSTSSGLTLGSTVQVTLGNLFTSIGTATYDWIRGRKYAASEGSTIIGSEMYNGIISVSTISGSPFCSGGTINISVPFSLIGNLVLNTGNVFTAQLSDSSGNFANPTNIGTLSGTNSGTINATIPAGAYGVHYKIRVINSSNSAYNSAPSTSILSIASQPKSAFTVNTANQCLQGNSFNFINTTSGSGSFTYSWDFADGNHSANTSPSHSYSIAGSYRVKLTVTNIAGCVDTTSQLVNIYTSTAAFSVNNKSECFSGNSFIFTNKSSGNGTISYLWKFGDGNTSNSLNPVYSFGSAGTYNVRLFSTNLSGCTDSASQIISVNPKVFASFNINNKSQCLNQENFTFTNTSSVSAGNLSYQWNFGDGSIFSTATNPTHNFKLVGNYIIKLTTTSDKGCVDTISETIDVLAIPSSLSKATGSTSFCDGGQVVLSGNTIPGCTFQWLKDGNKIIPPITSSTYTINSSGNFKYVITNSDGCTDTSLGIVVTVNPLPAKPVITQSGRLLLTNVYSAYQWNLSGKPINGATAISYLPGINVGDYSVTVFDSNGCSNTSSVYNYDVSAIETTNFLNRGINIYPNPAHNYINVDFTNINIDFENIQILDIEGRILGRYRVSQDKIIIEILLRNESKGIYFLRVFGKNGIWTQKFTVE